MTTNLLYIGKSKSFLTQFGKLEDVQLIYAKDHKDAITICINLKARENIIILYEQGNLKRMWKTSLFSGKNSIRVM